MATTGGHLRMPASFCGALQCSAAIYNRAMDYRARQRRLLAELERKRVDALLVTHLPNVRYLTGFTGSAGLLLAGPKSLFFTDGRYREQAAEQVAGAKVIAGKAAALSAAADAVKRSRITRLGIESGHMTVATREALKRLLGTSVRLVSTSGVCESLRMVKDADEVACLAEAVDLGSRVFRPLLRAIQPGIGENVVAARLEYMTRKAGAEAMSFETIVAAGARSALPHGVASRAPIPPGGFVVLDYGVILNGYCSDMTRTVHVGRASEAERDAYKAVLESQLAAVEAVRPGATAAEVDEAARSSLRAAKLDKYFTHSTGHGVGLEIHELPRVAAKQDVVLRPGMVITIEPGVYMPGKFGIRIEDMVVVRERGHQVLTSAPKELIEL